jgi:moderate conductance mechanosensitive channel
MRQSRASRGCPLILLACVASMTLMPLWSFSQSQGPGNAPEERHIDEANDAKKLSEEMATLQQKLKTATTGYEAVKKDLAGRILEAQKRVQQTEAALQKAALPEETQRLQEDLQLTQEWQSLLDRQLALAEEEILVTQGMVQVAEKRVALASDKGPSGEQPPTKPFTPQDAKVATEEAQVATEKAALAQGKLETLQAELLSLEKEAAEVGPQAAAAEQNRKALTDKLAGGQGAREKEQLESEVRRAKQRAEVLQKRAELTEKQLDLTRGKYELAKRESDLFTMQANLLEARAKTIREAVGISLEEVEADQEQAAAAQKAAETEKQKAQQEQAKAQQEREKAQKALEQAKTAKERATTAAQLKIAELNQQVAEKRAELAQKRTELAKEKIEVAEKGTELAQKKLELTTRRLEVERRTLTSAEILNSYERAKADAVKASKAAQSARANAELAKHETEALKKEAELAQLKAQLEKAQPSQPTADPLARDTIRALDEGGRVAVDRAQVAEERSAVLEERARIAAARAQVASDLAQVLAVQRSTYGLWKREPSKITWEALEEVSTDLVNWRSALIIGVSTLPEQITALLDSLIDPSRFWGILRQSVEVACIFLIAVLAAIIARRRVQPVIAGHENVFLPSRGKKLLRSGTRLTRVMALPALLLMAGLLSVSLASVGKTFFRAMAIAFGGFAAYSLLKGVAQELFMPWNPQQRLISCRNGIASYLYRHLRRISLYVTIFLPIIFILQAVKYHEGLIALLYLIFYSGLLALLILLTSNKDALASLLPHAENRIERIIYVGATWIYPLMTVILICITALNSVGYVKLARFLTISFLLTAAILAAAHLACKGLDKLFHWWLLSEGREERDFLLGRETAETLYHILSRGLSYLAYLVAMVMIAGTWGVDLSGVYATLTSDTAQNYLRRLLGAAVIILISTLVLRAAYYVIDKVFNLSPEEGRSWRKRIALGEKGKTIAPLLKSVIKYCTIFVAGVFVMRALGVDPTPIIAGAGVVGLAVGFGAQTLVKDVIAGFFLLFEGLIAVGDVITIGSAGGAVEEVGLRVTKYRTASGELWIIPNGEIRAFGNFNRQWTRAIVPIRVAYEQDVGKAMRVLEEIGKTWAAERRDIVLEPPQVQGILSFDDSAIALQLAIKVRPLQKWTAEWELRRRIKEAFDREGIEIPFPRHVMYTRPEANGVESQEQNMLRLSKRMQKLESGQPLARQPDGKSAFGSSEANPLADGGRETSTGG